MNLFENIKEAIRSVKSNLLRTILTGLIIAIGITSLVGMLTAIDGMKAQIEESLSGFGANNFDVRSKGFSGGRVTTDGVAEETYPHLSFRETMAFKNDYSPRGLVTVFTRVSGSAEVKRKSKKTNPNTRISGGDENYFLIKGINIEKGRSFSNVEIQYGNNVCVIGTELVETLFEPEEEPLNQYIFFYGSRYIIIGILEKQGGVGGDSGADRNHHNIH